jgi:hypothetical protein
VKTHDLLKNILIKNIVFIILSTFLINACNVPASAGNFKVFDYGLRGTWTSNDPGSYSYSGSLKIDIDTITINGYGKNWFLDDSKRPFKDFPKGVPLKGYSKDGKIFINYGYEQNGISYTYTETDNYQKKYKLLTFDFGGEKEILGLFKNPQNDMIP